jgi:hypothetical protein
MQTKSIEIGGVYLCRVGSRVTKVTVTGLATTHWGRQQFTCRTHDTDRDIRASATKLRPIPGSDLWRAEETRLAQRKPRRKAVWTSLAPTEIGKGDPVPDQVNRVTRPVAIRTGAPPNFRTGMVLEMVDRCHVYDGFGRVARKVRRALSDKYEYHTIPVAVRRALLLMAAQRHHRNIQQYREVMGHDPLPSERHIADAILRRVVLK